METGVITSTLAGNGIRIGSTATATDKPGNPSIARAPLAAGLSDPVCTMFEVKVHFFGDAMAILYGSESAIRTESDGRKHTVKLSLDPAIV